MNCTEARSITFFSVSLSCVYFVCCFSNLHTTFSLSLTPNVCLVFRTIFYLGQAIRRPTKWNIFSLVFFSSSSNAIASDVVCWSLNMNSFRMCICLLVLRLCVFVRVSANVLHSLECFKWNGNASHWNKNFDGKPKIVARLCRFLETRYIILHVFLLCFFGQCKRWKNCTTQWLADRSSLCSRQTKFVFVLDFS